MGKGQGFKRVGVRACGQNVFEGQAHVAEDIIETRDNLFHDRFLLDSLTQYEGLVVWF